MQSPAAIRRFVLTLTALTFGLLLVGGLVHNTRSSLACPDWPLCFGTVFPVMKGGVLVEHSHRIFAFSIGVLSTVLMVLLWRNAEKLGDGQLRWLGVAGVLAVCVQALLGGLTVIFRLPPLVSTAHLATGTATFCLFLYLAVRLTMLSAPPRWMASCAPSPLVARLSLATACFVYVQMLVGALMRHLGAGLACMDLPLCRGALFPAAADPSVQLHMLHRLLGVAVFAATLALAAVVVKQGITGAVRRMALLAPILVLAQIVMGWLSITTFLDVIPVTAHLGVAVLLLGTLWVLHLLTRAAPLALAAPAPARAVLNRLSPEVAR